MNKADSDVLYEKWLNSYQTMVNLKISKRELILKLRDVTIERKNFNKPVKNYSRNSDDVEKSNYRFKYYIGMLTVQIKNASSEIDKHSRQHQRLCETIGKNKVHSWRKEVKVKEKRSQGRTSSLLKPTADVNEILSLREKRAGFIEL